MLNNIRIVLVAPSHPGNIGAAARAMKNMGLSKLFLVAPKIFPSAIASSRAAGADDILANAGVVDNLKDALCDCSLTFATSTRERHLAWQVISPFECAKQAVNYAQNAKQVALVFGREHAGLTNSELQMCQYQVNIAANPEFSSLNLACAVQVMTYEIRQHFLQEKQPKLEIASQSNVTLAQLEDFYEHLQQTLQQIDFLKAENPRHLMARLRRLYAKANLDETELNILRGILTKTQQRIAK